MALERSAIYAGRRRGADTSIGLASGGRRAASGDLFRWSLSVDRWNGQRITIDGERTTTSGRAVGEVRHAALARVEDLEHRVELGDLQQGQDAVRRLDQGHLALAVLELLQVADQFAEAGRVHVVDRFEVDHHRAGLVVEDLLEIAGELASTLTELDDTLDVEDGDVVHAVLDDVHTSKFIPCRTKDPALRREGRYAPFEIRPGRVTASEAMCIDRCEV